jgi:F0F1-type ATP synthase, delta subunit (mitochondrial oligomycin sensitivity protein)
VRKPAVARRYAQALFELLDTSTIESTREALTGLGQAIKDSVALRHIVASPVFGAEVKTTVLAELGSRLGCPPIGKAFLGQLVKKNRWAIFLKSLRPSRNLPMRPRASSRSPCPQLTPYPRLNKIESAPLAQHAQAPSRYYLSHGCPPPCRSADPSRQHGGR